MTVSETVTTLGPTMVLVDEQTGPIVCYARRTIFRSVSVDNSSGRTAVMSGIVSRRFLVASVSGKDVTKMPLAATPPYCRRLFSNFWMSP